MIQEIEELTLEAIDALTASVKRTPGLITEEYWTPKGVCAVGSLGCDIKGRYRNVRRQRNCRRIGIYEYLNSVLVSVSSENDDFEGTPLQRKRHMLKWLRAQRAFKKAVHRKGKH